MINDTIFFNRRLKSADLTNGNSTPFMNGTIKLTEKLKSREWQEGRANSTTNLSILLPSLINENPGRLLKKLKEEGFRLFVQLRLIHVGTVNFYFIISFQEKRNSSLCLPSRTVTKP